MHPSKFEIILKVEETGSFTRTAEYYQYTQSAVSQAVKSVETELGVVLFHRTPSGITLSDEGLYVLPSIREIVNGQRHLVEQANEIRKLKTGTIRLGAYVSLSCHWLPACIRKFNALYPDIHFELYQLDDLHLLEYLQKDLIDMAFMADPDKKRI